jgi:hypothetical protein
VKRDDIRWRNLTQKEPHSKLKYISTLLWWVAGSYGILIFLTQAITFWMDFFDRIWPRITVEAKADQASLHNVEFTFKNEGRFDLRDVVLDTVLIWHEAGNGQKLIPYAQDEHGEVERVAFRDRYNLFDEIPSHGGAASANLSENLRRFSEEYGGIKRIGICQELSFQIFPLDLLSKWFPINKRTSNVGYMLDKPANVYNWRQRSCTALQKTMPDRKYYGAY